MKIVISCKGNTLEDELDPRFGRCAWLLVYETDNGNFAAVDNSGNRDAQQSAGIHTAAKAVELGAGLVITGICGPKAAEVLKGKNIPVIESRPEKITDVLKRNAEKIREFRVSQ